MYLGIATGLPDKNTGCPRTPARFTAPPLDGLDFVVTGPLVRAHGLVSGSCPSGRGFASGFLRTPPHDDALALGYGGYHQPPGRTSTFLVSAHAGRTLSRESGSPAPPLTPPDMRVRIRRFGERQGT